MLCNIENDYLRNNPDAVSAYEQLKIRAVEEAQQNGEVYRALKEPFIRDILSLCNKSLS